MQRYTLRQAATRAGISRARLHKLYLDGRIKAAIDPHSGWLLITESELKRFLKIERQYGAPRKNNSNNSK